jgi:hypothetical protein
MKVRKGGILWKMIQRYSTHIKLQRSEQTTYESRQPHPQYGSQVRRGGILLKYLKKNTSITVRISGEKRWYFTEILEKKYFNTYLVKFHTTVAGQLYIFQLFAWYFIEKFNGIPF